MTNLASRPGSCPVRKLEPESRGGPDLERVGTGADERWVVRSFALARELLRDPEASVQAGFGAEGFAARGGPGADGDGQHGPDGRGHGRRRGPTRRMRPPILYLEGAEHRDQRRAAARFFAPKVIEGYRPVVERFSAALVAQVRSDRPVDLSALSMRLAVQVAAQVVGLTASSPRAMSRRLDAFFAHDPLAGGRRPVDLLRTLRASTATARFYWLDVRPAIRARRRRPREDVISQLLADGFGDLEVLTECLTYAAAGMATTRELIVMAAWHLVDDPALLARFRAADPAGRRAVLEETLRLEPVVGHLYRRLRKPVTLTAGGVRHELPAGALVDLDLRSANADPATVGAEPYGLCPGRELPRAVPASVLGFGDGHHRCPGGPLAMLETEIFLSALFAQEVVPDAPPRVRWNPVSQGYDLDRFWIRRAAGRVPPGADRPERDLPL